MCHKKTMYNPLRKPLNPARIPVVPKATGCGLRVKGDRSGSRRYPNSEKLLFDSPSGLWGLCIMSSNLKGVSEDCCPSKTALCGAPDVFREA